MNELASILNSNIMVGFILLFLVVPLYFKLGILDRFFGKNGKNPVETKMEHLEKHFNDELTSALTRIEKKLDKLDEINEGIIWLKAKQKNGN